MKIGIPKEIKTHEYRVGVTPHCVDQYIKHGHEVEIETNAGLGAGFQDADYEKYGAQIVKSSDIIFENAEMIIKVKEPLPEEISKFKSGQTLYTYLHLASNRSLTEGLIEKGVFAIAYEMIIAEDGSLPCLTPMSEIAGRLSIQEAAKYLEKPFQGRGVLLGGVPGVPRGNVVILGGGVVGRNAAKIAIGMGANVTVLDISSQALETLENLYPNSIHTLYSNEANILSSIQQADVVIGAVLIPGKKSPHLIKREHLSQMKPGAVIVDVAVDQGGCFETTRVTSHDDPIFIEDKIVHYGVANMPGVVARTSTLALTQQTLKYGITIANGGIDASLQSPALKQAISIYQNKLRCPAVAESLQMEHHPL